MRVETWPALYRGREPQAQVVSEIVALAAIAPVPVAAITQEGFDVPSWFVADVSSSPMPAASRWRLIGWGTHFGRIQ
eukprot:scaffold58830_cov36-Phaeocystis_antarctica.AAC.1